MGKGDGKWGGKGLTSGLKSVNSRPRQSNSRMV